MGIIYKAACLQCDYREEFYLGGGRQSINLQRSIQGLNEAEQEKVRKLEEEGEIIDFSVENKLTQCQYCNLLKLLKDKTIIKITDKMQQQHFFGNVCDVCGKELQIFDVGKEELQKITCPNCEKAFLKFERIGRWD